MRLLPHDERRDRARALSTFGPHHLGPPGAPRAERTGPLTGARQVLVIPAHAAFQQLGVAPDREMRGMPEVHLEMELTVPAVREQPLFLRREAAGGVDGRQIAREHDTALELVRAWVG